MRKLLVSIFIVLTVLMGGVTFAQDNSANQEAKRIKEICTEYYNQNKDCPYDSVDGVPVMINGDGNQYQRFDNEKEVKIEKPTFQSK